MQFKNKNSKFITLREAAALFNYAPDYIGWLIRKGKIPGKKIYSREEWKVSREAILDYVNRNGRKKDYQKEQIFSIKKQKYISLKDAARISGYASDYIGYLIRENKIPGKKINFGTVWLTTKDAIKKYQSFKNNTVNKKFKLPFSINSLILSFGKEGRFYFKIPKYSFVFIILGIIIFGGWIAGTFTSNNQNQTIEIYSTSSRGDWQNSQNVQGIPDVGPDGNLNYFSDANSAVYQSGSKNLVLSEFNKTGADFEMINQSNNGKSEEESSVQSEEHDGNINQTTSFLGKIKNLFTNGSVKAETVPTFTELQNSQFQSAKIKFSFALGEKISDLNPTQTQETNPTVTTPEEKPSEENQKEVPSGGEVDQQQQEQPPQEQPPQEEQSPNPEEAPTETPSIQQETPVPEPQPEQPSQSEQSSPPEQPPQNNTEPTIFWDKLKNLFGVIPVFAQEENKTSPASTTEGEPTEPIKETTPNLDEKIIIWYSFDGELWWQLNNISSYPLSNAQGGGYFEYDAPFLKNWDDVKNLKIKFEGVIGGETRIVAYLDSVWVDATYKTKTDEEIKETEREEEKPKEAPEEEVLTSPAKKIRDDIKLKYPQAKELVEKRTLTSKVHSLGNGQFALDSSIGPIHYQDENGDWQEIDTRIEEDTGQWDWKMEKAGFKIHGKKNFGSNEVIEYRDDNEWITLKPDVLQYSNDLNQTQIVAAPEPIDGVINANTITWFNAYGEGLNFSWIIQPSRLPKFLTIQDRNNLPLIDQKIKEGGNPVLELNIEFKLSAGVSIFIDGKEWQGETKDVQGSVEFRDKEGNTLWYFDPPLSWDAGNKEQQGIFRFQKQGNKFLVSHRVPLSFIENAVYPLMVDATVEAPVGNTLDDGSRGLVLSTSLMRIGVYSTFTYHTFARWTGITIAGTINVAYIKFYKSASGGSALMKVYGVDEDNAAAPTTATEFDNDPLTAQAVDWDGAFSAGWNQSPPLTAIFQELVDSYTISNDAVMVQVKNDGGTNGNYNEAVDYGTNSAQAATLHIEYAVPTTVSGNIYQANESSAYNCLADPLTVRVKVNGAGDYTGLCALATGAYSVTISGGTSSGDILTVFLDGETPDATAVTKADGNNLSGFNLYQNHIITRAETGSLTIDNMDYYDSDNDPDIQFTATNGSPDTLTVNDGNELYVWTGDTFAPGGNLDNGAGVGIDDIQIVGTYTASGSESILVSGSWDNDGVFNAASSTVTMDCPAALGQETIDSTGAATASFYNLTLATGGNACTILLEYALDVNNDLTNNFSVLDVKDSENNAINIGGSLLTPGSTEVFYARAGTVTFDATTTGKTIDSFYNGTLNYKFYNVTFDGSGGGWSPINSSMVITGDLVMKNGTFDTSSGVAAVIVNGNVQCQTTCGTIDMTKSDPQTFTQSVSANKAFGTNVVVATHWKFYNLTFTGTSGARTVTFNATGTGQIIVEYNLTLTNSGTSLAVDNETNDRILDVNGSVSIGAGTTFQASSTAPFTVAGSWTNSGTFTANSGTITFDATSTLKYIQTGSSNWYTLTFNGSGGGWTFTDSLTITKTFNITNGIVTWGYGSGDILTTNNNVTTTISSGGTLQSKQDLAQGLTMTWTAGGTISVSGTLDIGKNATINLNSGASVEDGIEVESTGYLEIKGSLDISGTITAADTAALRETKICDGVHIFTVDQHNDKVVRMTSGLAINKIYTITDTTFDDSDCLINTHDSITRVDNSSVDTAGGLAISGTDPTRTVSGLNASTISADNEGIGRYLHNLTDDEYYKIVDSTDGGGGSVDYVVIIAEPNAFANLGAGDTVDISDGVKTSDTFEILDYATITAQSTNHGYIWAKAGSETLIQYADISELGADTANKYGVSFYSVNGANSNEGAKIDKSRIHDGYNGIYLDSSTNNNTTYSAGITDNALYSNHDGLTLVSSDNNAISSNISYSNSANGFYLSTSSNDNNMFSSNIAYNNTNGFYVGYSYNNILYSNTTYNNGNTSYAGIGTYGAKNNIFFANTAFGHPGYGLSNGGDHSNDNIWLSNASYSNGYGFRVVEDTGIVVINDDYGVSGKNTTADIMLDDTTDPSTLRLFDVDLTSSTEVTGVTYAGSYIISEKHDSTAGSTKIWGEYTVPDNITETVSNDEGLQQFNYADNLYTDSATQHGYSGTGTEDTDIQITLTSALSTAEWYRAEVTTANGDTPTFTITRSGGTASPSTCTLSGGPPASCTYTEAATGVQFTIQDGASNYVVGDTYTFVVWPKSNDTNTQKTLTFQQADDTFTAGSGEKVELKGQSNSANRTQITSSSVDTNYYSFTVNAGTIDAQYYDFTSLDTNGLFIEGAATVTELNGGSFDSGQSGGTYIQVRDFTSTDTFSDMVFDPGNNDNVTNSIKNTTAGSNIIWALACAKWKDAYITDADPDHDVETGGAAFTWGCTQVSGIIYTGEGSGPYACSGDNLTVKMEVNGAGDYTGTCTLDTGAYSIYGLFVATDTLTVFLDNETPDAVVVTESDGNDLSGLDLYQNHVIVRHDNGGSLTIDDMNNYDSGNDADIQFTATNGSPDTLTVNDGNELYIWTGDTFAPGGNLDNGAGTGIDDIKIVGTYTASGTESILVSGSWVNNGTFTAPSSTVTFDSTSSETLSGTLNGSSAFYKVNFNGSGGSWTIQDAMKVDSLTDNATDTFQVTAGTVTLGNGDGDNLEVAGGKFTVASGATFQTYPTGLSEGQSIIIDINHNSSPDNCSNCIFSNSGIATINKNVTIRLNSQSSVQSGIEVESTGYLEIQGTLDFSGTDTATDTAALRETKICDGVNVFSSSQNNKVVRMTSGLAFGKIYDITGTNVDDSDCLINTHDSITRADYSSVDTAGGLTISGSDPTRTVSGLNASTISADNEGIGRYLHNLTDDEYYKIVDSTDGGGSTDSVVIIAEPNAFANLGTGDTVDISDGVKTSDTFEILDYATVTASAGTSCNATNNGYIYAKSGSETLIQYADICDMGAGTANKYGVSFYSVDGASSSEGVKIDKSRIHDGYMGVYIESSLNNNSTYSAGFTDNAIYSNSSGIYLFSGSNNTFSSNTFYSNYSFGINLSGSNNNLSSNTSYSSAYGIYLFSGSNNNLSSNTSYSNDYGIYLNSSSNNTLSFNTSYSNARGITISVSYNNTLFSNASYSNTEGLISEQSTGNVVISDDYGVSGANSTADIVFDDSDSASNLKLFNVDLVSTSEATGVTYAGAYIISEKHDSTAGQTKIWGEYTIPDDIAETVSNDEGLQQFNYSNNLYTDSATQHGYSGTGTEDTDIQITLTSALSTAEWYRAEVTTANGDTPTFTITRSGGAANPATYTLPGTYTEASTGVRFTIQDGATNYVLGDTYTFVVWPKSNDTNTQKILAVQQSGDKITVGSGETLELKGGGLASSDDSQITAAASALWDLSNSGTITVQEATINYLNLASGNLTIINTTLNNEDTPDAGTNLYVDWYLGAHIVDATTPATNIDTGNTDVAISEITPTSTVWKWSGGAGGGWGAPSTSQSTGTDSNGLIPQPGNNGTIRIREYARNDSGYTFYKYNIQVAEQPVYGDYDYYVDQGNNYIISCRYSDGNDNCSDSDEDDVINENWQRDDIDLNNNGAVPPLNDPPTNGTWYLGMLPMLSFGIDSSSIAFAELSPFNNFTDTEINTLKTTTSARSGYLITAWAQHTGTGHPGELKLENLDFYIENNNGPGTNTSPANWDGNCPTNSQCGFGYNTNDGDLSGDPNTDRFVEAGTCGSDTKCWAAFLDSGSGEPVVDRSDCPCKDQENIITYKVSTSAAQPAGSYQTTVIYICTANY